MDEQTVLIGLLRKRNAKHSSKSYLFHGLCRSTRLGCMDVFAR
nr:MAG TPA: hypothetical protein [Caudoviricetes sp.]